MGKIGQRIRIDALESWCVASITPTRGSCGKFAIEASIQGRQLHERFAVRQTEAIPKLGGLKTFLETRLAQISAKGTLARAIRYALRRWDALTRYTSDGRLEICNNAAERAIRPLL